MDIGILGGTFDPIHIGHLVVAEEARIKLGFSEVLFVPAGQPWLKLDRAITPAVHRVEMVRLAIASNPCFRLCTLEVERPGPSYTVDTLIALREQLGSKANLFFILGRDALAELPLWKEPQKLVQLCRLVVAPRPVLSEVEGPGSKDLRHLEKAIPGLRDKVVQLDMPVIGISSSEIRQRLAQGLPIRYLVPPEVEKYLTEQRLYLGSPDG
ncbi:MAG: nicotinate-nucleotide adenylyltransferase [Chloroflexi bacterium]|nr:nicotinate-nucleotide adenylyltransferase [Chloroflexota bacterium]